MDYVIEAAPRVSLPVKGELARFPVNNVFCVGRNYADHTIEMGGDPDREPPFLFIKPAFTLLQEGEDMQYPAESSDVHHEVELVVAIAEGGMGIRVEDAMSHVYGYASGVDMTRRDLQAEAKKKGRPWEAGKTFLHAAPCSAVVPIAETGVVDHGPIELQVNGATRQSGDVGQMIWKVPEIISRLSELFTLTAGDLIFTGTPAGVGPVARGDRVLARIDGLPPLMFNVR